MGNSDLVQPLGHCTIPVQIGGTSYIILFTVLENCVVDVILGWDFLSATDATIDCASRELLLNSSPTTDTACEPYPIFLHASGDYILPPLSAAYITLMPNRPLPCTSGLIEPIASLVTKKPVIIPYCIADTLQGQVSLFITNTSVEPQIVPRGARLATLTTHIYDNFVPLSDSINIQTLPAPPDANMHVAKMIDARLSDGQKEALTQLLLSYDDLFDFDNRPLAQTSEVSHHIETGEASPVRSRPYRVSSAERQVIHEHVTDMLRKKIIEPSSSPWSSPVVLVKKKDGTWRFCVDYRRLNKITSKDVYPLPRIDDTLDTLQGSSFFSSMDLRSGYWQIPVADIDKPKTAFITSAGLYQFNVMPFGLCNAPATFERMMDTVLRGLTWKICLCYLDDIIVFSRSFSQHLDRLKHVLDCFRSAHLQLN